MKDLIKCDLDQEEAYMRTLGTNDNNDNWAVEFTDKYTIATWCGYDDPTYMKSSTNEVKKVWDIIVKSTFN